MKAVTVLTVLGSATALGAATTGMPDWLTDSIGPSPFTQPLPGLDDTTQDQVVLGRSFFSIPWVAAPSATTARDGLGPLFNANTCASCHNDNGSALTISADGHPLRPLLFKLARPDAHEARLETDDPGVPDRARMVDAVYGGQIAINGVGNVSPEARPQLDITPEIFRYPDGAQVTLERLTPALADLAYGPLATDTVIYTRQPPVLAGLGLIEAVPDAEILVWEDPDDSDGDGISGRANRLPSGEIGRYAWKAAAPTLIAQTANAAANDMGLTNRLYPTELCQPDQTACLAAPHGRPSPQGMLDLPDARLDAITTYLSAFKAPQPMALDAEAQHGKALFAASGCTACHRPELTTSDGRTIHPMSDYLLHDMGSDLADGVREQSAGPSEFRTAPLWGLGARLRAGCRFLHDARAATPEAAILWHGGEAANARTNFIALEPTARDDLLHFLEQL